MATSRQKAAAHRNKVSRALSTQHEKEELERSGRRHPAGHIEKSCLASLVPMT